MVTNNFPLFSIVIPTCNEGPLLDLTVQSILDNTEYPQYEIIVVDDGSTDGSCDKYENTTLPVKVVKGGNLGVAGARNAGALAASGELIVFLDAHCRVSANWLQAFAIMLQNERVALAGPAFTRLWEVEPKGCGVAWTDHHLNTVWFTPPQHTSLYEVPLTIGACQAFRTKTFFSIGQYEETFTRWGYEDVEICLRAWLLGYTVQVNAAIVIAHYFRESRNYEVEESTVITNFLKMLYLHFSQDRIDSIVHSLSPIPGYEDCMEEVRKSNVLQTRQEMEAARIYDDQWFFHLFPLKQVV